MKIPKQIVARLSVLRGIFFVGLIFFCIVLAIQPDINRLWGRQKISDLAFESEEVQHQVRRDIFWQTSIIFLIGSCLIWLPPSQKKKKIPTANVKPHPKRKKKAKPAGDEADQETEAKP